MSATGAHGAAGRPAPAGGSRAADPAAGSPPGLLMVTNAAAGAAEDEAVAAAVDVLRTGADVRVEPCHDPSELAGILQRRDGRRLVVAGGDGSLQVLVRTLRSRGELTAADPVGLLALGTGNDLARSLGVPLAPREAARVVLRGRPRRLDLLVDDAGGVVVNAVHLGAGAEAARAASRFKPALGPLAYPLGALAAGVHSRGWRLRVEADGAVLWPGDSRVLMVGIGNGSSVGGGARLAPRARPDDGLVDVVVSAAVGPLRRIGYAVRLRRGRHLERDDVRAARARTVRVVGEPFPVNADGEVEGPVTARSWTVLAAAWSLLTP